MIDLNSGSGFIYGRAYNPATRSIVEIVNEAIDSGLMAQRSKEPPRDYLGASRIGEPCARKLAYEYLKVPGEDFTARTLRIFEVGHRFEDMMAEWLRNGGFGLKTENRNGHQFGFETGGGKIKGHIDGVLISGPDLGRPYPGGWEAKAINNRSWSDTVKKGVKLSKPVYYAQMILYSAYLDLSWFLFTAINKDTCEIYSELVLFNAAEAQALSDRAVNIIRACEAGGDLPPRIAANPDFYLCRFCGHRAICWSER